MEMENEGIQIVGCGVLAIDLKHVAQQLGLDARLSFLPGGLHASPTELRRRLQETIAEVSDSGVSRIVVGYGVCGRGTVGIRACGVPLVIPRVHDCIALFLGSDARYRDEFSRNPGTYYLSAGWVEEKGAPGGKRRMGSDGADESTDGELHRLIQEYGESNAHYIRDFMESWKTNYTRAAFIDSGLGERKEHYARLAETLAQDCGWKYERLAGTHDLLRAMLTTVETTDEILVVPPSATTHYDAIRRRLDVTAEHSTEAVFGGTQVQASADPVGRKPAPRSGIGLGIDAGGTYTDAVLYDFATEDVIDKAKALTTRWDFILGINEALEQLDAGALVRANMVAVSTTLATNAIVEGEGQRTGLLLMPPCGWRDVTRFRHEPIAIVSGQLSIDGTEREPVDLDQIRRTARDMIDSRRVMAFAVGGYASHANPAHELAVKSVIEEETGLHVTCSHDLSDQLDYQVRSETAALNARIIPCMKALMGRLRPALAVHGVGAPIMVVRSDGSLMSLNAAHDRPLETMLSGPAASVAGASHLACQRDAVVIDVGGTTTDTAVLRHGVVDMCERGATIGPWQTHIRALNLRTLGLGGDSLIRLDKGSFSMGPDRVTPVSWLAAHTDGCGPCLDWLEAHLDAFATSTEGAAICFATGGADSGDLDGDEKRLLGILQERPRSLHEAAAAMGEAHMGFLPLERLEALHLVQRSGLTPTDLLHANGTLHLWDGDAARRVCGFYGELGQEEDLPARLLQRFERDLAAEVFKKEIAEDIDPNHINAQPAALALIDKALRGGGNGSSRTNGHSIRLSLTHPVIGIGAPAACFVPAAAERLHTRAVIPGHADVANAVGAIAGSVALRRRLTIAVNELGQYRLGGVPGAPAFECIEEATAFGARHLRQTLMEFALRAGAAEPQVEIATDDSVAAAASGEAVFLGRTIEGRVTSRPVVEHRMTGPVASAGD